MEVFTMRGEDFHLVVIQYVFQQKSYQLLSEAAGFQQA